MNVGQIIKQCRKDKKLTLKDLAKKINLSFPYISQIESGSRKASPEILQKISKALDINYLDLMISAGYLQEESIELKNTFETTIESRPSGKGKENDIAYLLLELEFKLKQNNLILFEGHIITDKMRAMLIEELNGLYSYTRSILSEK